MSERQKYRQRWIAGSMVQIDLLDGTYAYAQVLESPQVAFYDYKTTNLNNYKIDDIVKSEVIFKVSVMRFAVTQYWKIVGKTKLDYELNKWDDHFYYDNAAKKLFIRKEDMTEILATWDECKHLENHAIWNPEHVEERLRDHFARRPCKIVEFLKPDFARDPNIITL